jgi:hypothetical protein
MNFINKLFLVLVFLYSLKITSQNDTISDINFTVPKKYNIELKIGGTGSFFNTEISHFPKNGYKSSFRLGVRFGAQFNYLIKDNFFVSGGVQLNSRGGQYKQKNNNVIIFSNEGSENAYYRKVFIVNYLEIPVTLGYNVRNVFDKNYTKQKSPVFVSLGIIPAFNIGSKFKENSFSSSSGSGFGNANESFDIIDFDYANSFLVSGLFKVNFVIRQTKEGDFFNEISYSQSFIDVYTQSVINSDNYKTKMSAISFGFGFRFK